MTLKSILAGSQCQLAEEEHCAASRALVTCPALPFWGPAFRWQAGHAL